MKKKFLVPIMALAIAVTAGVNYKMISNSEMSYNTSLSMLVKNAFADDTETSDCNDSSNAGNDCYGEKDCICANCGAEVMMCDRSGGGCDVSAQGCPNCD